MRFIEKGLIVIVIFEDGTQFLVKDVFSCTWTNFGELELTIENDNYREHLVFNKKVKTWVSVDDEADLIYEDGKCIGWKKKMYFDKEKN